MTRYLISGVPFGCIYALVGLGLVITYRSSGVFNLAFGAQAYLSAAVFYETRGTHRWPLWAATLTSVVIVGGAVGYILERVLFRRLRTAPMVVRLVSSLGLLVGIPALIQAAWLGVGTRLAPPALGPTPPDVIGTGTDRIDTAQLAVVAATVLITVAIGFMFRYTPLGLRMRAVVESPRLAELVGVDSARVSSLAWIVSSVVAGLAGVLLAPLYRSVDVFNFDTLVVAAIAAAAIGRLTSLSLTVAGGLVLGIGQELITAYLPLGSQFVKGLRPSLPFLLLLIALLAWPSLARRGSGADPLAGVDPPTATGPIALPARIQSLSSSSQAGAALAVAVVMALVLPSYWLYVGTEAVAMGVVFLSFTVLVGMSGQVSLCQAEFAGIGAFTAGQLASHYNLSVVAGLIAGGVVAGLVGVVAAVPSLRVGGIYLALATFAFGLLVDNLVFPQSWAGNGTTGIVVPRPLIGPVSFNANRPFFALSVLVLALAALLVSRLKRGTIGLYLGALRGSEVAAESIGIDVRRAKVVAFTLSAGVAGLGGALLGTTLGAVSASNFTFFQSLFWLVVVAITGVRTVGGAVAAGVAITVVPEFLATLPSRYSTVAAVLFGFGALSYIRHQEGLVPWASRAIVDRARRVWSGGGAG
ncbi:MAG TPA: ABC transporter permease [Acidimicrobiales bacterium]|nr:ABC transporter permease [Acidimicrobiales bacterium]